MAAKKHRDAQQVQQQAGAEDVPPAGADPGPEAGGLSEEKLTRLRELGELHEQKVLNDEEFEREKAKLLEG
jgi:Short C-terminal domain